MAYLTDLMVAQINKMNEAARRGGLGTLLASIKDAASLAAINSMTVSIGFGDFVDGGATVGTYTFTETIPVGATFLYGALTTVTEFTGDTSAALTIGDGTDVDRYNNSTIDVFSTIAGGIGLGTPAGVLYHDTAKAPVITITSAANFTAVDGGALVVVLYYLA